MIVRIISKTIIYFACFGVLFACQKEKVALKSDAHKEMVTIYNFHNTEDLEKFRNLKLDDSYDNLLNPQIDNFEEVLNSWTEFHQRIGQFLADNNFAWGVDDENILMMQKIYFSANGEIEHYFFNVVNKNVSAEKKEEFSKLLEVFSKDNKINLQRLEGFAQCGKTKYRNL